MTTSYTLVSMVLMFLTVRVLDRKRWVKPVQTRERSMGMKDLNKPQGKNSAATTT